MNQWLLEHVQPTLWILPMLRGCLIYWEQRGMFLSVNANHPIDTRTPEFPVCKEYWWLLVDGTRSFLLWKITCFKQVYYSRCWCWWIIKPIFEDAMSDKTEIPIIYLPPYNIEILFKCIKLQQCPRLCVRLYCTPVHTDCDCTVSHWPIRASHPSRGHHTHMTHTHKTQSQMLSSGSPTKKHNMFLG